MCTSLPGIGNPFGKKGGGSGGGIAFGDAAGFKGAMDRRAARAAGPKVVTATQGKGPMQGRRTQAQADTLNKANSDLFHGRLNPANFKDTFGIKGSGKKAFTAAQSKLTASRAAGVAKDDAMIRRVEQFRGTGEFSKANVAKRAAASAAASAPKTRASQGKRSGAGRANLSVRGGATKRRKSGRGRGAGAGVQSGGGTGLNA